MESTDLDQSRYRVSFPYPWEVQASMDQMYLVMVIHPMAAFDSGPRSCLEYLGGWHSATSIRWLAWTSRTQVCTRKEIRTNKD